MPSKLFHHSLGFFLGHRPEEAVRRCIEGNPTLSAHEIYQGLQRLGVDISKSEVISIWNEAARLKAEKAERAERRRLAAMGIRPKRSRPWRHPG